MMMTTRIAKAVAPMRTLTATGKKIKELVASCAFKINKLYKLKVNIRRLDIILSLIVLAERIGSM